MPINKYFKTRTWTWTRPRPKRPTYSIFQS